MNNVTELIKEVCRLESEKTELLEALEDALACLVPTGQDTRSDRAIVKAQTAIAKFSRTVHGSGCIRATAFCPPQSAVR